MFEFSWWLSWIEELANSPWRQGVLAAVSTFILEDPTTISCGLLVADKKMAFLTAFWGLSIGLSLGDLGLYWLGRTFGHKVTDWGLVSKDRLQRAESWFSRNLVAAVLLSRFLPGMRLPTYVGAGILGAPVGKFLGVVIIASAVWTLLLLSLTVELGEAILPLLGRWKWPLAGIALALVIFSQWLWARKTDKERADSEATSSHFEFWPPYLFYIPVFIQYLRLSVRYRSLTLPTAANPSVFAGGLIGESKSQILDLIPPEQAKWVAPYFMVESISGPGEQGRLEEIEQRMRQKGLTYPVVVKPDMGQRGAGVRPLHSQSELSEYLAEFPPEADLVVQELIPYPGEAGILFYRFPEADQGTIFSVTLKSFPRVTGNGEATLRQLIEADPRARQIREVYFRRHRDRLQWIPEPGEEVPLVFSGNHCQGAIFHDGTQLVTQPMVDKFEEIVSAIPEFYFGRFDVRFESLASLTQGEGFRIIALNGAGAEATHIWDANFGLRNAYRVLFRQFEVLFEIGHQNRRRGHAPIGLRTLLKSALHYRSVSRGYPLAY